MRRGPFEPRFEDLPSVLPIFPLPGALLLPRGRLPLNIFEPRYLAMTADALGGPGRLIGMIQPTEEEQDGRVQAIHPIGCAGRIVSFSETDDGRYLLTLGGVARFRVAEELPAERAYRRVVPDWTPYRHDLDEAPPAFDRERLIQALKVFFEKRGFKADWDAIGELTADRLIVTVSMVCPFSIEEKQALLEARNPTQRAAALLTLLEIAAFQSGDLEPDRPNPVRH